MPNHKFCTRSTRASVQPTIVKFFCNIRLKTSSLVVPNYWRWKTKGDERLGNELGVATSLYVFSKIALKRSFSNKSVYVKVAKATTLVIDQAFKLQPIVANINNNNPNSACRQDEVVVLGVKQLGQEHQQNN